MRHVRKTLIFCSCFFMVRVAAATAGFAEWEVKTPGGNFVNHTDPYIAEFGTSIFRAADEARVGPVVEQIEWWQYYSGYVSGKGKDGFFLFSESETKATFFIDESSLKQAISRLSDSSPISKRLEPHDGWNESWIGSACKLGEEHPGIKEAKSNKEKVRKREQIKVECRQFGFPFGQL